MSDELRTQVRLPAELGELIKRLAEQERRSMNAQIVILLEEAIEARQAEQRDRRAGQP